MLGNSKIISELFLLEMKKRVQTKLFKMIVLRMRMH